MLPWRNLKFEILRISYCNVPRKLSPGLSAFLHIFPRKMTVYQEEQQGKTPCHLGQGKTPGLFRVGGVFQVPRNRCCKLTSIVLVSDWAKGSQLTVGWQKFSEDTQSVASTVLLQNHHFWESVLWEHAVGKYQAGTFELHGHFSHRLQLKMNKTVFKQKLKINMYDQQEVAFLYPISQLTWTLWATAGSVLDR